MNSNFFLRRTDEAEERAFSRTDLAAIIGVAALLSLLLLPALARESDGGERAICLNNMQRIMAAVAMYSADNNDSLPHPSWGSDLTGPNNWCYATRLPTGEAARSASGRSGPDAHIIQLPFYVAGQLARFLDNQRVLVCPADWRESMGSKSFLYVGRAQKLTSYAMSGTVGGYVGPKAPGDAQGLRGKTFNMTDFLPTDMLLFESNESDSFYFNDAALNPENVVEVVSRRHELANGDGMAAVGRAGSTADFVNHGRFWNLTSSPKPNDLFCGPGYR
jgi:hypothetical protein